MGQRHFGRYSVEISNEDKIFFPDTGLTKGGLIAYYERIADRILPHLRDRPLVLQRFPDGVERDGFYQKQAGDYFPDWITTTRVDLKTTDDQQELVVCDNQATLVYLIDQGSVTLHPWLSRSDRIQHPDSLIFDLDPPDGAFDAARRAALRVRDLMDELELPCFAKLTGSNGLHLLVPLDRSASFEAVRELASSAMSLLARRHPEELTTEQRKAKRAARVYLDIGRNAYGQTAVAPWSVRARSEAPIAAPVAWADVENPDLGAQDYTVENVFRRIGGRDDPWHGLRRRAHALAPARDRLARILEEELDR